MVHRTAIHLARKAEATVAVVQSGIGQLHVTDNDETVGAEHSRVVVDGVEDSSTESRQVWCGWCSGRVAAKWGSSIAVVS